MARSILLVIRLLFAETAKAQSPAFHEEIERRLLDLSVRRFNVVAPRGHAKSTLVAVAFVLWHVFLEDLYRYVGDGSGPPRWRLTERGQAPSPRQTRKHVVIVSKTQSEAIERVDAIKAVLGDEHGEPHPLFLRLFGDWGVNTARVWTRDLIVLKDGTVIRAKGTAQPIRGLNKRGMRPTLVVLDDPEDEENTKTLERMQANLRWLFQAIIPALDARRGRLVVIGTPQNAQSMVVNLHHGFSKERHEEDQIGSDSLWFENDEATGTSRWSVAPDGELVLADGEAEETDDFGRWVRKPDVLWPQWVPLGRLREEKRRCEDTPGVGVGVYYREWECKVVGDEEQVFKPAFFQATWHGELARDRIDQPYLRVTHLRGVELAEPMVLPCLVTRGIDPAFSVSSTADRTAIFDLATTFVDEEDHPFHGEHHWELPGVYRRVPPVSLIEVIERTHHERRPERGLIEVTAQQIFMAVELQEQTGIRYLHDRPQTKKKGEGSRIERLEFPLRKGTWHSWTDALGVQPSPLRGELLSYPRGHDDYADAAEKAYRVRLRPSHTIKDLVLDDRAFFEHASGRSERRSARFDPLCS